MRPECRRGLDFPEFANKEPDSQRRENNESGSRWKLRSIDFGKELRL